MAALPQNDMGKMVKVQCGECSKMLSFTNLKRHMKTVHNEDTGKRWICNSCGKASQSDLSHKAQLEYYVGYKH